MWRQLLMAGKKERLKRMATGLKVRETRVWSCKEGLGGGEGACTGSYCC